MKFFAFLLVAVVVKAFAQPQPSSSFQSNDFSNFSSMSGAHGSSLPVINTHIQTSVVENPTVNFPSYIPPNSISESCHCMKTLVRPQLLNELITVPTVDRIFRTVSSPFIETIDCGDGTRLTTFTPTNVLSGVNGFRNLSQGDQNKNTQRVSKESNRGKAFATGQNTNSQNGASSNSVNFNLATGPSVFTFQPLTGKNLQRLSNPFFKHPGLSNGGINGC